VTGPIDPVGEAVALWAEATSSEDDALTASPRSVADGAAVELVEVTAETVRAICRLLVAPDQSMSVAPNAVSLAEALFTPAAWYRAVVADGMPVGFVMLELDPGDPPYLWRLMIDRRHQGRGYGRRTIELVADHLRREHGATELFTSWVPGERGPERFYLDLGFAPTGEIHEGEVVARLAL
jgi:diamine N-acetyltransferase